MADIFGWLRNFNITTFIYEFDLNFLKLTFIHIDFMGHCIYTFLLKFRIGLYLTLFFFFEFLKIKIGQQLGLGFNKILILTI